MALQIFDTLTREKREFVPLEEGTIKFYHCGPTVYWTQQIGNMRAMVLADLIRRTLGYLGYDVNFVRNYTDVGHLTGDNLGDADTGEDRMEQGAKREGLSPKEIADKYIAIFEKDVERLNVLSPNHTPRATEYIQQIIDMIQVLLDKGFAYQTEKAIYFDISKAKDYNKLNKQNMEENREGAGSGDVSDPNKKNPQDFALWFFKTGVHANALQTWDSPFGDSLPAGRQGFPGWHIECSAMIKTLLGDTIDLHMGGVEHIPIHHTNEIAQSESANGVEFVKYWLHNEHLLVDNKKMAKSEGTSYSLDDVIEKDLPAGRQGFDPIALRYFFLQSHYRSRQNFTWEGLKGAATAYKRLQTTVYGLRQEGGEASESGNVIEFKRRFVEALEDDFNVPYALGILWDEVRSTIPSPEKLSLILDFNRVLGLEFKKPTRDIELPQFLQDLISDRDEARKNIDWAKSDELRQKIEDAGYGVKDTSTGTAVNKKN
ncbi:MAG: cysteine--tRNA ligase [bacterium]|nr:cysteine--tRNA ligase [bacterium]